MKNIAILIIITMVMFGIAGCGSSANNPEDIALRFTQHIARGEFESASELGSEGTQQMLSFLVMMTADLSQEEIQEEFGTSADQITVVRSSIEGDQALVVLHSSEGEEFEVYLSRIDGDWKVDLDKEDMMGKNLKHPRANLWHRSYFYAYSHRMS